MKRFFLALLLANAAAASASLTQAIEADLEAGRHAEAVRRVDEMERQSGRSPRLESLRAVALEATGDKLGALRSLLAYTDLTRGMNLRDNEAHVALIEMRDRLRNELREEYRKKKDEEESRRRREGAETARAATTAEQAEGQRAAQAYAQRQERLIDAALKNATPETLETLKRETRTAKTDKLDVRALRIADLDTGDVRLGMPLTEFAALVTHRVRRQPMQTSMVRRLVEDYRFKLGNDRQFWWGLRFGQALEAEAAYSVLESDLFDRGLKVRDYDDYVGEFDRFANAIMPANQPAGLGLLAPGVALYRVTAVKFDAANRVQLIRMHFVFPWAWRDVNAVRAAFTREFGPPWSENTFTDSSARTGGGTSWYFSYGAFGPVTLSGNLRDEHDRKGERERTYVMELELARKP
jgi:hypothetical protein